MDFKQTILLISDDKKKHSELGITLEPTYTLLRAFNGADGLSLWKQHESLIRLVLIDSALMDQSIISIIKSISKTTFNPVILAISDDPSMTAVLRHYHLVDSVIESADISEPLCHAVSSLITMSRGTKKRPYRPHLLIIHPSEKNHTEFSHLLENFHITLAKTVSQAQSILDQNIARYDIIICHHRLSDMSGLDVITLIRQRGLTDTPILITADHYTTDDVIAYASAGAMGFCSPPYTMILPHEIEDILFMEKKTLFNSKHVQQLDYEEIIFRRTESLQKELSTVYHDYFNETDHDSILSLESNCSPQSAQQLASFLADDIGERLPTPTHCRVLLIEDDDIQRELMINALSDHFELTIAHDLSSARQHLSESPQFDLVLLDIALPDGMGYDFISTINDTLHYKTHIVILTGYDDTSTIMKSFRRGAHQFINKQTPIHNHLSLFQSICHQSYYLNQCRQLISTLESMRFSFRLRLLYLDRLLKESKLSNQKITYNTIFVLFPECLVPDIPLNKPFLPLTIQNGLKQEMLSLKAKATLSAAL